MNTFLPHGHVKHTVMAEGALTVTSLGSLAWVKGQFLGFLLGFLQPHTYPTHTLFYPWPFLFAVFFTWYLFSELN